MQIHIIDSIERLDKLKPDWNAVYSLDPHTTIHRSWAWLRGWAETLSDNWLVLAIRPHTTSPYVGFMALGMKDRSKLYIGGQPLSAHTGFVCVPEYAEEAIPTFSAFIQERLEWDVFEMRDVFDPRLDTFLKCFSRIGFNVRRIDTTPCPYVRLPKTWDQYLQDFLRKTTRRMLKYKLNRIKRETESRETQMQPDNSQSQIETLLTLWQRRWGRKSEQVLNQWRAIMRRCFENDSLWLTMLWDNTTPIVGLAAYVDHHKKIFSYFMSGYNDKYAKLSPGRVIVARSIQYAISNNFSIYDFGRGNMSYKYSFGAKDRFNQNAIIYRNTIRNTFRRLVTKLRRTFNEKSCTNST